MTELKSKKQQFLEEFNHFCDTINFGQSALDCQSIQFMNEFNKLLDDVIKEGD